jgi:hypothetical protein
VGEGGEKGGYEQREEGKGRREQEKLQEGGKGKIGKRET